MLLYKTHPRIWLRDTVQSIINPSQNSQGKPLFFVHIPKTAGTAFRYMLYHQFRQKQIFPNLVLMNKYNDSYPRMSEVNELDKEWNAARIVMGHYSISMKYNFLNDVRCFTFLRNPLERSLSNLSHILYHHHTDNANIEEVYESARFTLDNFQTRLLMTRYHTNKLQESDLNLAKMEIDRMSCFGITEHFSKSIELMEKTFNWKLGTIKRLNAGPGKKINFSEDLKALIVKNNHFDFELYNYALERFEALTEDID